MKLYAKRLILVTVILIISLNGCAYYNTFFNAEENYRLGLEKKNAGTSRTTESSTKSILKKESITNISSETKKYFTSAITKSWTVIEVYGDSSAWADDALILIGKSHFQIEEYDKAQEIFEQFLKKYRNSPFVPDAELWLAKTFLRNGDSESALKNFQALINKTDDSDLLGDAYFNIGELYFQAEKFEQSLENFEKCVEINSNDDMAAEANYRLGDVYYKTKSYSQAIEKYEEVLHYDIPLQSQYDAVIQMVNCLLELNKFEQAEETLKNILRDQRFIKQYSMIAAKLAGIYEFQGDYEYALSKYYEVTEKYPRTEGASLAAFNMGHIYEFDYGLFDSAKTKYDQCTKEFPSSEVKLEAQERGKLLGDYLAIRNQIDKDRQDIYSLEHGDSSLIDSLTTGVDTLFTTYIDTTQTINPEQEENVTEGGPVTGIRTTVKTVKKNKIAISRKPEEVEKSLLKNMFGISEYFLLNYQNYDSAKTAYWQFINNFEDSLLTPKAYYSLYFLYTSAFLDSVKADSIKQIIINKYPNTQYGLKFSTKDKPKQQADDPEIKNKFREAEKLVDKKDYRNAIGLYNKIAESDSGSIWAQKARYATAYIYENYLSDTDSAYNAYKILAEEYPKSKQGIIALNKSKEPEKEEPAIIKEDPIQATTQQDSLLLNNEAKPDSTQQELLEK